MKVADELMRDWPMATEMRKLESRLWQQVEKQNLKTVLVTSALRGEGKSTTVAYLATALALNPSRRILAVDMDFRRPSVNTHFKVAPRAGLTEFLRGECALEAAITKTDLPGLDLVLPAAGAPEPALLQNSGRLGNVFQNLRAAYDLIVIDTPAIIPVPDAAQLIPLSDGVILVVMAGVTPKHHLVRARELCLAMGANILGLVVGNVQEAAPEYLDTSYYGYGDSKEKTARSR